MTRKVLSDQWIGQCWAFPKSLGAPFFLTFIMSLSLFFSNSHCFFSVLISTISLHHLTTVHHLLVLLWQNSVSMVWTDVGHKLQEVGDCVWLLIIHLNLVLSSSLMHNRHQHLLHSKKEFWVWGGSNIKTSRNFRPSPNSVYDIK